MGHAGRIFHDPGRFHDRRGRKPQHHEIAEHLQLRHHHLGHQRLSTGLCRATAAVRSPRGPVRTEEPLHDRAGGVHSGVAVVRAFRVHRHADRRAGGPGRRRRTADTADAVDHHPHLPGGPARCGAEHVGCDGGDSHPGGAPGRRGARRPPRLVVDLLRQRADRDPRPGCGRTAHPGAGDPSAPLRLSGRAALRSRPFPHRLRPAGRPDPRLAGLDLGDDRRRRRDDGGVRLLAVGQPRRATDPPGDLR